MSLEKGLKLMADMGSAVVEKMGGRPTMPSDSSIKNALIDTAKKIDDYTSQALDAVKDMAERLLSAVKSAISAAIGKTDPEVPKPSDIASSIYQAILDAGKNI